jgi:F0F1-type ATP synthase epsilon subunit
MPGVVAIHNGSAVQEFFVSGGFATIDGANAHVTVAEAVPVETIDGAAVAAGAISRAFRLFGFCFCPFRRGRLF